MQLTKYKISTFDGVWSKHSNWSLSSFRDDYILVSLYFDNWKKTKRRVHRFLALAFITNTKNKSTVDHANTIRDDNNIWNLEWVTSLEQIQNRVPKISKSSIGLQALIL